MATGRAGLHERRLSMRVRTWPSPPRAPCDRARLVKGGHGGRQRAMRHQRAAAAISVQPPPAAARRKLSPADVNIPHQIPTTPLRSPGCPQPLPRGLQGGHLARRVRAQGEPSRGTLWWRALAVSTAAAPERIEPDASTRPPPLITPPSLACTQCERGEYWSREDQVSAACSVLCCAGFDGHAQRRAGLGGGHLYGRYGRLRHSATTSQQSPTQPPVHTPTQQPTPPAHPPSRCAAGLLPRAQARRPQPLPRGLQGGHLARRVRAQGELEPRGRRSKPHG